MTTTPASRSAVGTGAVEVRPVQGRAELRRFIRLPFRIHAADRSWVPPLDSEVKAALSPAHPFHRHADVRCFLARRGTRVVGRIAAIHNRTHTEFHEEPAGFFGLFECENDAAAAAALLDAAGQWLRARGLTICRGPFNLSTNDELWSPGILIDGFHRPPCVMMGHNPPYYAELVEAAGYVKSKDLLAYWLANEKASLDRLANAVDRIRTRSGVTLRTLDVKRLDEEVSRIQEVYNSAWEKNWGFLPMRSEEIEHLAASLKPVVDPERCLILEKDGEAIGFGLGLPDYNQVLMHLGGRLFPIGWLKFLLYRRRISLTRILTLGLRPGYRNRGLDAVIILELFRAGVRANQGEGECSWILEDNWEMRRGLERIGAVADKTYRVYEKSLT